MSVLARSKCKRRLGLTVAKRMAKHIQLVSDNKTSNGPQPLHQIGTNKACLVGKCNSDTLP